jgi:hypothetical protein
MAKTATSYTSAARAQERSAPSPGLLETWWAWARSHAWLGIVVVLLVAGFFRLWQIGSLPPGLFGDEATDGLDALDVLAGRGAIFFPANYGREGLHIWLVAGMFRLLGVTPLAVRLPSVIAGLLTVLATYWLGIELVRATTDRLKSKAPSPAGPNQPPTLNQQLLRFVPLVAALYLGTSYFHVHFSRFGIRGAFTPLFGALAFAAFWRGVNLPPRRYLWFAISGLCLGLSLHFYTASRFYPFFLAGFLLVEALICLLRRRLRTAILARDFGPVLVLYLAAAVVFAPLGLYFIQHPGSFSQRAAEVSAFSAANPWPRIGQAALANVLQFFLPGAGDPAQFYNFPGRAVFEPLTAVLVLVGIIVLLWRIGLPPALFLLLWWPALTLPAFLATDRWPTLPRVLGTIPGIYFFPAIGLLTFLGLVGRWLSGTPRFHESMSGSRAGSAVPQSVLVIILAALGALAILVPAASTFGDYFLIWGRAPETYDAFEADMTQAAEWLAANPTDDHIYLSSDIYRHPTFMLLHEKTPVSQYFQAADSRLSWFDARTSLPLPPAGEQAIYLISAATPPMSPVQAYLVTDGSRQMLAVPPGETSLVAEVILPPKARRPAPDQAPDSFTPQLSLLGARWAGPKPPQTFVRLYWETSGPDQAAWPGYIIQISGPTPDGGAWQQELPLEDFRPSEWVPKGRFFTWHELQMPQEVTQYPAQIQVRLLTADKKEPVTTVNAPDGWHTVAVTR